MTERRGSHAPAPPLSTSEPLLLVIATIGLSLIVSNRLRADLAGGAAGDRVTRGQVRQIITPRACCWRRWGCWAACQRGSGQGYTLVAPSTATARLPVQLPAGELYGKACAVGLAFVVLAALLPAHRAVRLDMVATLRWE